MRPTGAIDIRADHVAVRVDAERARRRGAGHRAVCVAPGTSNTANRSRLMR